MKKVAVLLATLPTTGDLHSAVPALGLLSAVPCVVTPTAAPHTELQVIDQPCPLIHRHLVDKYRTVTEETGGSDSINLVGVCVAVFFTGWTPAVGLPFLPDLLLPGLRGVGDVGLSESDTGCQRRLPRSC